MLGIGVGISDGKGVGTDPGIGVGSPVGKGDGLDFLFDGSEGITGEIGVGMMTTASGLSSGSASEAQT